MNDESSPLPWDQLQRTTGEIPWSALHAFAEAVARDHNVMEQLFEVYDQGYEEAFDRPRYADLYVAAIFALAAPRLRDEQRREIGSFLLDRMVQAGVDDADISLEVLMGAAGAMGPVILPAVLDTIANEPDAEEAWFHLWGLVPLVARSEDETLHDRVIRTCVDLLEKVEHDEVSPSQGTPAAQTLASLGRTEYTDLLQRLSEKPMEHWWIGEYKEAVKLLREGRLDYTPLPELWEEPVEKWFPPRWKMVKDWFEKRRTHPEPSEEETPEAEGARTWTLRFLGSPVAQTLPIELRHDVFTIVHGLLLSSLAQLDREPDEWDEPVLRELLLEILPEKLPADRPLLEKIVPVTEALLYWLGFEGVLDDADALIAKVRSWSEQIVAAGLDPQRWGPAKRAMMQARAAGLDATEAEIPDALPVESLEEDVPGPPPPGVTAPPIPISEYSPKVGRNDPCPCGSGRKYKKCHGRPEGE